MNLNQRKERSRPGGLAESASPGGIGDERRTSTVDRRIRHSEEKVNSRKWERVGDYAIGSGKYTVSKTGDGVYLAWRRSSHIGKGGQKTMPTLLGGFLTAEEAKAACRG